LFVTSEIVCDMVFFIDQIVSWCRSIVVRTSVLAGGLSLSCARLMDDYFVGTASVISQPTRPTQPAIPPGSVK